MSKTKRLPDVRNSTETNKNNKKHTKVWLYNLTQDTDVYGRIILKIAHENRFVFVNGIGLAQEKSNSRILC